jgi:hypothetical protein
MSCPSGNLKRSTLQAVAFPAVSQVCDRLYTGLLIIVFKNMYQHNRRSHILKLLLLFLENRVQNTRFSTDVIIIRTVLNHKLY